jgi:enterochelin esterase-like enzyme
MTRKPTDENARAEIINPTKTGMRTGNPQVAAHEGDEVRSQPRQRAPRSPQQQAERAPAKTGDRTGG